MAVAIFSLDEVNKTIDWFSQKIILFLQLSLLLENTSLIAKAKGIDLSESLEVLYLEYEKNIFLIDIVSEVDMIAKMVSELLAEIKTKGALVEEIGKGRLSWPGKINGKDILWSWQLGEGKVCFWRKSKDYFALRCMILS